MKTVPYVDLQKFMGEWFVIASVPTFFDKAPYNAVERYALNPDGSIATTYLFRDGSADAPLREMNAKAFVRDEETNAEWGMQFVWPIRADYRIVYLEDDYSVTVIGRSRRDFVWIMARSPTISETKLEQLFKFVEDIGYDREDVRLVPHVESNQQQAAG